MDLLPLLLLLRVSFVGARNPEPSFQGCGNALLLCWLSTAGSVNSLGAGLLGGSGCTAVAGGSCGLTLTATGCCQGVALLLLLLPPAAGTALLTAPCDTP